MLRRKPAPAGLDSSTWASRERIVGVDRLLDRVSRNAADLVQLAPGTLEARLYCLQTRGLQASGGRLSLPIRSLGRVGTGFATLTFKLDCPGDAVADGRRVGTGSVLVWRPGAVYDGISPAGERWATLLVPWSELPRRTDGRPTGGPWRWKTHLLTTRLDSRELDATLVLARHTERLVERGRVELPASDVASLRAAWVAVARDVFRRAVPFPPPSGAAWRATLEVRAAERYMLARLAAPVYLPSMCRAIGARPRTLQASFRLALGCTPMAYLDLLRLHAVYHELRSRDAAAPGSVAEAARRCGVTHLSRLAGRFRAIFGAPPSEVLREARASVARDA